jgi:molecular chaperone Hsp33
MTGMPSPPPFLDTDRPAVPDLVVARAVLPFYLPRLGVRGRVVRLGPLAEALLARHDHPPAVARLAGKALALTAALGTALKYRGSFSVQAKGDGPVGLLVADCTEVGALRCHASVDRERLAGAEGGSDSVLLGEGYLAFTVDQGPEMERHQGIVAIEGDDLAAMAEHYFAASAQMNCLVRLAADRMADGWRAGALVLERVAALGGHEAAWGGDSEGAEDTAGWRTAAALAATVTPAELLDETLTDEDLLFRLFNETEIRVDLARALAYGCRCSRARLAGILGTFGDDDLDHMTRDEDIVMTCEFCNFDFRFPRAEVRGAAPG